jgi:glyoxylase-like metal-dependent hydrolase (beta-lactamase superfamily II)
LAVLDARIARIELPTPFRVGPVNVYLLAGDGPLTLVDAGPNWQPALEALEAGLRGCGVEVEQLQQLVLTHQHFDHMGLARKIRSRSGAMCVALDPLADYLAAYPASVAEDDEYAVGIMRRYGTPDQLIEEVRTISRSFWSYGEAVDTDRRIRPGDVVNAGGQVLRTLWHPGHSPTDSLFVDDVSRTAFVGDHLLGHISSNPVAHRPIEGDARARPHALATYLDSLEKTGALELAKAWSGHGPPIDDVAPLIRERIEHHRERKETIFDLIESGIESAHDVGVALWGRVETSQVYLALSEVLGHTDLLIADSKVREVERAGVIHFEAC